MDASHKVEVESLQTQLADLSLEPQNHKTKFGSLAGQKARLIFEEDQLQSKLEDHILQHQIWHTIFYLQPPPPQGSLTTASLP
ncbi:uncharacterized protein DFL_003034 [Arthrobotrys flagrans]|uniref:Uncharacterized protein n=1 Tax=Arthrobotrys flagrans TaxID=97331 RepID=A0A437AC77_ARTFL|nr:hypothetical protein DFL_003034 [Arthrobotrys flagrans]